MDGYNTETQVELRDFFAAHNKDPFTSLTPALQNEIVGRERKYGTAEPKYDLEFFLEGIAKWNGMVADAQMKEREQNSKE